MGVGTFPPHNAKNGIVEKGTPFRSVFKFSIQCIKGFQNSAKKIPEAFTSGIRL